MFELFMDYTAFSYSVLFFLWVLLMVFFPLMELLWFGKAFITRKEYDRPWTSLIKVRIYAKNNENKDVVSDIFRTIKLPITRFTVKNVLRINIQKEFDITTFTPTISEFWEFYAVKIGIIGLVTIAVAPLVVAVLPILFMLVILRMIYGWNIRRKERRMERKVKESKGGIVV